MNTTELDIKKIQHLDFEFEIVPDGFEILTKDEGEPERTMTAVISSANIDRVGDRVLPGAFKNLGKDGKTIPLLWSHDRSSMPIGKSVWIKNSHKDKTVVGKFVFRNNPQSKDVWDMINEGFITKVSVGFNVLSEGWEQNDFQGYDISKAELLEVSLVNIPANRDAVVQGVKGMMDAGHEFCDSTLKEFGLLEIVEDDADEEPDEETENGKTFSEALDDFRQMVKAHNEWVETLGKYLDKFEEFTKQFTTPDQSVVEESGEDAAISNDDEIIVEKSDPVSATSDGDEQGIIEIVEE